MAYNIHFSKGSLESYRSLSTKDPNTLYFVTDIENPAFYLGETKLSSVSEVAELFQYNITQDQLTDAIKRALSGISLVEQGSVKNAIDIGDSVLRNDLGDPGTLNTVNKVVVSAINELRDTIIRNRTDSVITMEVDETKSTILKTYRFKQGDVPIGEVDIPKDLVVKSGKLVEIIADDEVLGKFVIQGADVQNEYVPVDSAGTYIELIVANQNEDAPIYINVSKLIDVYTAAKEAPRVQLKVIGTEISGDIVKESITYEELADNAVITTKIADNNVTEAKLSADLKLAIDKATSAVQTVSEGITDYHILVDNTPVRVHGLGSAALKDDDYFDLKNAAAEVLGTPADTHEALTVYGAHAHANKVEQDCKAYTDNALTWRSIGYTEVTPSDNSNP